MSAAVIDKLALLYLRDQKLLMVKSKGQDTFFIPGGKREKGESDVMALTREIREELKVDLIPSTLKFYGKFRAQAHSKPKGVVVEMSCYLGDFHGEPRVGGEIEKLIWHSYQDKGAASLVSQIIYDDLHSKRLLK